MYWFGIWEIDRIRKFTILVGTGLEQEKRKIGRDTWNLRWQYLEMNFRSCSLSESKGEVANELQKKHGHADDALGMCGILT